MITAYEEGRRLVLVLGEGSEDEMRINIAPLNTKAGAELFAEYAGVAFGASQSPEQDAENFARRAVGEENWPILDELRWDEANLIINAAFFWNVQGGGMELVRTMLSGGLPKARETLFSSNGLGPAYSQLTTLLNGASANPIQPLDDSPATTTHSGSEKPSKTVQKLPREKRSINQSSQ